VARRKRIVVLGGSRQDTALHCVDSQNVQAARQAVRHLLDLGHERIVLINGPMSMTHSIDRLNGYLAELQDNKIPVRKEYILDSDASKTAGPLMAQLMKLMRSPERPTAILACGYYLALDVMILLRRMSMRIGRDVSLIGFDDPKSASLLDPPLTAVQQPLDEMGARAYRRILQMINGESPSPRIELLPTSLIVRDSTGPVS
jgi:DNA-binding LacI/PurR family transcriptional regulator